ncbi:MAG: IS1634 family transposase [Deltaproteobacteria bacterium]|nr:IS1634 family transposase [Deltaproteobacteria bacterium]
MPWVRLNTQKRKDGREVTYVQIVRTYWDKTVGRPRQKVLCTLGRLDKMTEDGNLVSIANKLLEAAGKLEAMQEAEAHQMGFWGPSYLFFRLWQDCGLKELFDKLTRRLKLPYDLSQVLFELVLQRMVESGSKLGWFETFRESHWFDWQGAELHHYYQAMDVLIRHKEEIEKYLYFKDRDLFTPRPSLVFFDTTSTYFEGSRCELSDYGYSRDRRPDREQVLIGVALDERGMPLYHQVWEGGKVDRDAFLETVRVLKGAFGVQRVILVADRGCVSTGVIEWLEQEGLEYILGMRLRGFRRAEEVLCRAGRYSEVRDDLLVKEVKVDGERYLLCYNPQEAEREARKREEILRGLYEKVREGKALVGNRGYRRYLKPQSFEIDEEKVQKEARYDGKWILRTNTGLCGREVALAYKDLWKVERVFRELKEVLALRPIYHWKERRVRAHVFICFLALYLERYLMVKLGEPEDWGHSRVVRALKKLKRAEVEVGGRRYRVRTEIPDETVELLRRAGYGIPPRVEVV